MMSFDFIAEIVWECKVSYIVIGEWATLAGEPSQNIHYGIEGVDSENEAEIHPLHENLHPLQS